MDFIRANLGASQAEQKRIESLEKEVNDYKQEVSDLKSQLEAVKVKLTEYEKKTDEVKTDEKKQEKPIESVQATDDKASESKPTNVGVGGAEADAVKDKTVAESEKAATPSAKEDAVDSAKASNESETAEVGKSNATDAKNDDEKTIATATADADKAKSSENDVTTVNSTANEK